MKTFPALEKTHSCVIVEDTGRVYCQSIDAYRFQREMSISPKVNGYTLHVYQHPGRREIVELTRAQGGKLIARFLGLVESYPTLLFNEGDGNRASNEGFVHWCEAVFRGQDPLKALD